MTFEEILPVIEKEIQKRRVKWTLDAISWLDWDDVVQILKIHISKKFHLWDQSRPIHNWVAAVIHNQLINLTRNLYFNFSPPCNRCAAFEGGNHCSIYGDVRGQCPLFAAWSKTKANAYNVKLPLPAVYHEQEIQAIENRDTDIDGAAEAVHEEMEKVLSKEEFRIYSLLFIDSKSVEETARIIGRTRAKDVAQLKQLKKTLVSKVRVLIYNGDIEL